MPKTKKLSAGVKKTTRRMIDEQSDVILLWLAKVKAGTIPMTECSEYGLAYAKERKIKLPKISKETK